MSALFAIALAAATAAPTDCSWDNPGANPYTGTAEAAIDRYVDLPEKVRARLKYRLQYGNPDEVVTITREAITGKHGYNATIRDMHFGKDKVCGTVSRARWSAQRTEPGAVYCADGHCILVPEICGNVSRVTRLGAGNEPDLASRSRAPVEKTLAFDWNDHVGTYELGLYNAPEQYVPEPSWMARNMPSLRQSGWEPLSEYATRAPAQPRLLAGTRAPVGLPVTPVPEADTWAMLLAGLGMLGFIARRRRR